MRLLRELYGVSEDANGYVRPRPMDPTALGAGPRRENARERSLLALRGNPGPHHGLRLARPEIVSETTASRTRTDTHRTRDTRCPSRELTDALPVPGRR